MSEKAKGETAPKAYAINLARSQDRRSHILRQLSRTGIGYELVEAVDGRELDLADTSLFDPALVCQDTFRPGAAGCALSHLKVYRKILDDDLDHALVLEDDAMLPDDAPELTAAVVRDMRGAEVVLLNFHSDKPCQVVRTGAVPLPAARRLVCLADEDQASSTGGYVITREACARMLDAFPPLRSQPDAWALFRRTGILDRVRCVVPMPIANSAQFRTTIDFYRPETRQARLREAVARARIPVLYQALALRRSVTFRRSGWTGRTEFID